MGNRVQGEGDYESARRFNKEQQDFVKRKLKRRPSRPMDLADARTEEPPIADDATTQIRRGAFDGIRQRGSHDRGPDEDE